MKSRIVRAILAVVCCLALGPAPAADPSGAGKVIRVAFLVAETGFDPQAAGDVYSNHVNRAMFDPLFRYEYFTRPYRVAPNTAAALPQISADGKTWTIKVRPGIYFADDPVFKGARRELVAADYVYSIKRILDPRTRSNSLNTVDGRFGGFINLKTRIWDIAPVAVILPEAGGRFTHVDGRQIVFELDERATERDYAVLGASSRVHARLAALTGCNRGRKPHGGTRTRAGDAPAFVDRDALVATLKLG